MAYKQKFAVDGQTTQSARVDGGSSETGASGSAQAASRANSATLEEVWRTHARQILRVTQRITKNREDAEDALQDSFLRAYVNRHTFDGRSSLATWLTRIAINSALMILRKRANAPQLSIDDGTEFAPDVRLLDPVDQSPGPEANYAEVEQQAKVRATIGTLRPSIREALELQVLEERSIKEIAEKMELSITATKSRIFQAKAGLRKSLGGRRVKRLQFSPA